MDYFISDLHIGHNKEFIWKARGFSSIEEHDTKILKQCNEIVGPEDHLWILGDLAMGGDIKEWNRIYKNLICQNVHYIQGNHDTDNKMDIYEQDYKFIYHGYADIYKPNKKITFYLSHYPTMTGNYKNDGHLVWNLSGHTHSKNRFEYGQYNIYNVAADAHDCKPISIERIIKDIMQYIAINKKE